MKYFLMTIVLFLINIGNVYSQSNDRIALNYCKSDYVFLAEVKEVNMSPLGAWSGAIIVNRPVTYKIKKFYKGSISYSEIVVEHPIYINTKIADKKVPRLSPILFKKGAELLVFIKEIKPNEMEDNTRYYLVFDTDFGVIKPTTFILSQIEIEKQKIN